MDVKVEIQYFGKYARITGIKAEELMVDNDIEETYKRIVQYLHERYDISPPFTLMVGGNHIIGAMKRKIKLEDGDVFKLLPFMSGG